MEDLIKEFLTTGSGYGFGSGSGSGSGYGSGYGFGDGSGDGSGFGSGYGFGYGSGSGYKSINHNNVYMIDGIPTIITHLKNDIVKGYIVQSDLTFKPCYIVKKENEYAHGDTIRSAIDSLDIKLYSLLPVHERVEKFKQAFPDFNIIYPAKKLLAEHRKLTGSCEFGCKMFCEERQINVDNDKYTIWQFIELTKNSYKGHIVRMLLNE